MATPTTASSDVDALARDLSSRINEELPGVIRRLLSEQDYNGGPIQLECSLLSESGPFKIASVDITDIGTPSGARTPFPVVKNNGIDDEQTQMVTRRSAQGSPLQTVKSRLHDSSLSDDESRPPKRRATGGLRIGSTAEQRDNSNSVTRRLKSDVRVFPQRKKRQPDNPGLQPSSLSKFVGGVWDSIFSGVKLNPAEVIEQWQAVESIGQPRLLLDANNEMVSHDANTAVQSILGWMSVLARKISQTSRTCRSLEVIVQAHWVQAFDDRVAELAGSMTREKAKKTAVSEACVDFSWTEKELRNKMAIWRGYHDIKEAGGWAALVFAGMGLYRFCKYRVSFTEETFQTLKTLRHRFEVAADCLHPRWRTLLAVVGAPTQPKYTGHPHDFVVCGPGDEAIPLAATYQQWDKDFSYIHLDESAIDEDAWGLFDPRTVTPGDDAAAYQCSVCGEEQDRDPRLNYCLCFPAIYGSSKAGFVPVQVYRTPNGKNNGLLACSAFERGTAIGEFVGEITSGLANLDVMVGQTERTFYQIYQGRQGNHTRFVNHSCQPNSQFERFVWLGTQRVVLVSKGIEAGEEITVDYSDTYWKNLDKECLCESAKCRYRRRQRHLLTSPEPN